MYSTSLAHSKRLHVRVAANSIMLSHMALYTIALPKMPNRLKRFYMRFIILIKH